MVGREQVGQSALLFGQYRWLTRFTSPVASCQRRRFYEQSGGYAADIIRMVSSSQWRILRHMPRCAYEYVTVAYVESITYARYHVIAA